MGKGFNKARNKQDELAQKMQAAKEQQQQQQKQNHSDSNGDENENEKKIKTTETDEARLQREREEFAKLLKKTSLPPPEKKTAKVKTIDQLRAERAGAYVLPQTQFTDNSSTTTPKGPRVNAKILKKKKRKAQQGSTIDGPGEEGPMAFVVKEGDKARRRDFEMLLSTTTGTPLGPMAAASLVPWVPPYISNSLVVVADPRPQSGELYQTIQYLVSNLDSDILSQVVVITADPPATIVSWEKRVGLDQGESSSNDDKVIRIFSDNNKLDWMRTYSAIVDSERWSMSIMIFCTDGILRKVVREVSPSMACAVITNTMIPLVED